MKIEFFHLSEKAQQMGLSVDLINVIKATVNEFAVYNDICIKVIGFEDDLSSPKLFLVDQVIKKEYHYEINLFSIRITKHGFEILTNEEEEYKVEDINSIYDIVVKVLSNSFNFNRIETSNEIKNENIIINPPGVHRKIAPPRKKRAISKTARSALTRFAGRTESNIAGKVVARDERTVRIKGLEKWSVRDKNNAISRVINRGISSKIIRGRWNVKEGKWNVKGQDTDTNKQSKVNSKYERP